jgi:class I fructose-bisphosphate aldolase
VRPPHPLTRYQVANCYMGRAGLINSGGASSGDVSSPAATLAASTLPTPPT